MRVRLQTSGGIGFFPGLAAPRSIDLDALDGKTRETVTTLIREADFFNLRPQASPHPGAADHCTYRITVEDGARHHTIRVCDPVMSAPLQQLIDVLRTL